MARDKILTLTEEQHKLLGHALALAHAVHSQMGGNGLGVAPGELPAIYDDIDIFVMPGAHGGRAPCLGRGIRLMLVNPKVAIIHTLGA